ncbi:MAG: hypothetical protein LBS51_08380 [Oscillospiraceae bacterium]|jgi:hypothetical protein|nr:hypothetical protein [Oscillospiraceae bacterium]
MQYITGVHALNLPCELETCGDWHCSALRWRDISFRDTEQGVYGLYGIEYGKRIPEHTETYAVANHIRALLDLLEIGNFAAAQGMNDDFICNDNYTAEVFDKVSHMRGLSHWAAIDRFMGKEYRMKWLRYKQKERL